MLARLYISLIQDPDKFAERDDTVALRVRAMAEQNAEQAAILRTLEEDDWRVHHDHTTRDTIIFAAQREFSSPAQAINAARLAGATDHLIDWQDGEASEETLETGVLSVEPQIGDRFALTCDVERFPHFIAPRGAQGTVTEVADGLIALTLDDHLPGAEEWDNALILTPDDSISPHASVFDALRAVAIPLVSEPK